MSSQQGSAPEETATVEKPSPSPETVSKPEEPKPKVKLSTQLGSFFQLLVYANPTWVDILLLITGTISAAAAGVPFPLMGIIFGQLLDDLNSASCEIESNVDPDVVQSAVNDKVLKLVYIAIASFVLIYIYTVSWSIFSRRLEARLRNRYFKSLLRQDATFYDKRSAGELSSRLNADIQAVQSGTSEKVGICIACVSFFLTAYIVAFTRDAKLAGMLISLIPAFLLMAGIGSAYTQKFYTTMSTAIASASSIAQEALSHIAVVQAFGAGPRLEAKFASKMLTAQKEGVKKALAAAIQAGTLYFIAFSANALAFWQGSKRVVELIRSDGSSGSSVGEIYTVIFLLVDGKFHSFESQKNLLANVHNSLHHPRLDSSSPTTYHGWRSFVPKAA
jgi:ABC-type multidrug transport system fused ATPase/permease subunit